MLRVWISTAKVNVLVVLQDNAIKQTEHITIRLEDKRACKTLPGVRFNTVVEQHVKDRRACKTLPTPVSTSRQNKPRESLKQSGCGLPME